MEDYSVHQDALNREAKARAQRKTERIGTVQAENLMGHHRRLCVAPIPTPSLKWLLIQKKILMVGE